MSRIVLMIALVVSGSQVFALPFDTGRYFRSTLLDVFGFTNTQLGDLFAVYGVVAMIAYFPGGALADRYSARSLMTVSLIATGLGGLYMATIPNALGMGVLYGYWGATTIFLFWGALIKATRDWGGDQSQGTAFGILESGRGLGVALIGLLAVFIFDSYMPTDVAGASPAEREASFRMVIYYYTLVTFLSAALVWFSIPADRLANDVEFSPLHGMAAVARRPIVWATAGVVICAYCGFKGLDNYQLYAVRVLGMNEVEASKLFTWGMYMRPVAALLAGLIADRFDSTRSLGVIFAVLCASYGIWSMSVPDGTGIAIIYVNFFLSFGAVFALRGIYFALLEENATPKHLTGAAVGMISLLGFTPEVFFAPIGGRLLDANPGIVGFQNYFLFLSACAALGIALVLAVAWLRRDGAAKLWQDVVRSK
ncbi:MAG: MFS transporter [Pseudomonadota bacterium]